jgi:hypothetical protein
MARRKDPNLDRIWQRRIQQQASRSLSMAEFCRREGISPRLFYAWRDRLAKRPASRASEAPPLLRSTLIRHTRKPTRLLIEPSSLSCLARCDFVSMPRLTPNGWGTSSPRWPASHARGPHRDHAPLDCQNLSLH